MPRDRFFRLLAGSAMASLALTGCAKSSKPELPPASFAAMEEGPGEQYVIGRLDEHSGIRVDLYANWFQSGSTLTGDTTAFGATASYYRNLTRHLSATAAVGINGIDWEAPLVDDWIASAPVGLRYSF
jgi:hypothetical protein